MELSMDHLELLSALNANDVKYLVVGGYAVGFHSEPRATKDIDVFIRSDQPNSEAVFRALAQFGAPPKSLSPQDFNDGESYFQMGHPPNRSDLLQSIDGVDFDSCWANRVYATLDHNLRVPVISAQDLIRNKLAAGRMTDLVDVEAIRAAQASANQSLDPLEDS
jgi:hypothetical protein